jgi:hypothetical protein
LADRVNRPPTAGGFRQQKGKTMTLTEENTQGYTESELQALNAEWDAIVAVEGLEPETDEYYQREKQFHDEVSRR